ncbi:hypothetical protein Dsin_025463 [Dipteronia sinensis]|uniref:SWIM-type domain-containing protein n=1 Tax=Dipteronia sinensis TaxID=43782 RepID=A0AAD9ZXA4_9ROSI|nr:hypothetical protein Dsin_025463 [Dipteronia sinensis]
MRENFEWKVKRSNKSVLHLVCKHKNCTWKLRAVRVSERTYFQVRSFENKPNCPFEEVHRRQRQASAVIIGEVIAPRLQDNDGRIMCPRDIIGDMKSMYGIQLLYSKAHASLQYALSLTYGTHEESFHLLTSFAYVLEQLNHDTITDIQCTDDNQFLYFFMSFGASIQGFRRCMRPVIAIDGTHLNGRYLVSDRHASNEVGIRKVLPNATHVFCIWHISENVRKKFHRKDVTELFQRAARAYRQVDYDREMEELKKLHKNAYEYVLEIGPHKWSRVYCPRRRFSMMTTNVAECLNSCLRFARKLLVMTLAEFIRNMLQKWFYNRHQAAVNMRSQLIDAAHAEILERIAECNIFLVKLRGDQWTVNLLEKICTCKVFDLDHLPCAHALAAARERNLDYTSLCADYYKKEVLADAYSILIMSVGHPNTWVIPPDIKNRVVLTPDIRTQSGRPRRSRFQSVSSNVLLVHFWKHALTLPYYLQIGFQML